MGGPNISCQTSGMMRESEVPIVVEIDGTTQPIRSEGASL